MPWSGVTKGMKALRLKITGIVQGVWFRASTKETADRLGVYGWVRNAGDGSVEVHAQGDERSVDMLHQWCHRGPAGARVEQVEAEEAMPEKGIVGFSIRR